MPPPDSVPMIDAPPPTSEPSPTTTPAEIRPSTIDGAERAGVVVDEALVHDRRALGQVGAEPDPVGVGDPDPGGDHVVDHPRELVHPEDGRPVPSASSRSRVCLELLRRGRPGAGPDHVGQHAEDAGHGQRRAAGPAGARAGAAAGTRPGCRPAARTGRISDRDRPARRPAPGIRAGSAPRTRAARRRRPGGGRGPAPGTRRRGPGRPSVTVARPSPHALLVIRQPYRSGAGVPG